MKDTTLLMQTVIIPAIYILTNISKDRSGEIIRFLRNYSEMVDYHNAVQVWDMWSLLTE